MVPKAQRLGISTAAADLTLSRDLTLTLDLARTLPRKAAADLTLTAGLVRI